MLLHSLPTPFFGADKCDSCCCSALLQHELFHSCESTKASAQKTLDLPILCWIQEEVLLKLTATASCQRASSLHGALSLAKLLFFFASSSSFCLHIFSPSFHTRLRFFPQALISISDIFQIKQLQSSGQHWSVYDQRVLLTTIALLILPLQLSITATDSTATLW